MSRKLLFGHYTVVGLNHFQINTNNWVKKHPNTLTPDEKLKDINSRVRVGCVVGPPHMRCQSPFLGCATNVQMYRLHIINPTISFSLLHKRYLSIWSNHNHHNCDIRNTSVVVGYLEVRKLIPGGHFNNLVKGQNLLVYNK